MEKSHEKSLGLLESSAKILMMYLEIACCVEQFTVRRLPLNSTLAIRVA